MKLWPVGHSASAALLPRLEVPSEVHCVDALCPVSLLDGVGEMREANKLILIYYYSNYPQNAYFTLEMDMSE